MPDTFLEFATSTVATPPSPAASGTSITVASGTGPRFSVPSTLAVAPTGQLPTSVNAEYVRVTARSGDVLTVTRTQGGTTARTILAGDVIYQALTAATLNTLLVAAEDLGPRVDYAARFAAGLAAATPAPIPGDAVYAMFPPAGSGLLPILADGSTDDRTRLQAILDWVKAQRGTGVVVLPMGKTVKVNSGITIPTKVRLTVPSGYTTIDFSAMTSGSAVTVYDTEFCPLEGLMLKGPATGDGLNFVPGSVTGVNVRGYSLQFKNVFVTRFNRAWDANQENTYIIDWDGCVVTGCNVALFADYQGVFGGTARTNAGERLLWRGFIVANCVSILKASGGGCGVYFQGGSMDYSQDFGEISDAHVFVSNVHQESKKIAAGSSDWGTVNDYLYTLRNEARAYFSNVNVIMAGSGIYHHINPNVGPNNYTLGSAHYSNCTAYFNNTQGQATQTFSEHLLGVGVGTTTANRYSFFMSKWCPVWVVPVANDGDPQRPETPRISALNQSTGLITITWSAATTGGTSWALIRHS